MIKIFMMLATTNMMAIILTAINDRAIKNIILNIVLKINSNSYKLLNIKCYNL